MSRAGNENPLRSSNVVMVSYCHSESSSAIQWRRDGSAEPSRESLQRLFTVDDGSEWSFENKRSGAIGVGGYARDNSRKRLSKIIE